MISEDRRCGLSFQDKRISRMLNIYSDFKGRLAMN